MAQWIELFSKITPHLSSVPTKVNLSTEVFNFYSISLGWTILNLGSKDLKRVCERNSRILWTWIEKVTPLFSLESNWNLGISFNYFNIGSKCILRGPLILSNHRKVAATISEDYFSTPRPWNYDNYDNIFKMLIFDKLINKHIYHILVSWWLYFSIIVSDVILCTLFHSLKNYSEAVNQWHGAMAPKKVKNSW